MSPRNKFTSKRPIPSHLPGLQHLVVAAAGFHDFLGVRVNIALHGALLVAGGALGLGFGHGGTLGIEHGDNVLQGFIVIGISKAKKATPLLIFCGIVGGLFFFGFWLVLQRN